MTGRAGLWPTLAQFDIGLVSEKLTGQVVHMKQPEIISSTAVKLNWEVCTQLTSEYEHFTNIRPLS